MTTAAIEPLTEKQNQAFAALKDGESPSGIAKLMSISAAGAHSHIKALVRKGYINDKLEILYAGPVSVGVLSGEAKVAKPAKARAKAKPAKRVATKGSAPKSPTFDEMVPATNGRHPSFDVDAEITKTIEAQRDLLGKSLAHIETAVVAHRGRIAAIEGEAVALTGERAEHEDAIASLEVRIASVKAALNDLASGS